MSITEMVADQIARGVQEHELLRAARQYLEEAEIHFPYATLELRDDMVVLSGVPECGEVLICSQEAGHIENYL
ncbi:MAG: hypothetical protein ABH879_05575 [archaeon]